MDLQQLLDLGRRAGTLLATAKEAADEFIDLAKTTGPTLGETDKAKLRAQLDEVHAKTMAMGKDLNDAIDAALRDA